MTFLDTSREENHRGPQAHWYINQRCNYSCKYCFYSSNELRKEHPRVGEFAHNDIAKSFNYGNRTWWIYITGGEPFLYSDFVSLCRELTRNHFLTINTNLSTSNVEKFAFEINPHSVYSINASLHIEERLRREGALREFIYRVRLFQDMGFQIRVEYVMHPTLFHRVESDIKMLCEEGISLVNLKAFKGFWKGQRYPRAYTSYEVDLFERYALDKTEVDFAGRDFSFYKKVCRAGRDLIKIDCAGDMYRCSTSAMPMGNFFESPELLHTVLHPCVHKRCRCANEGLKYALHEEASMGSFIREFTGEVPHYVMSALQPARLYRYVKKRVSS